MLGKSGLLCYNSHMDIWTQMARYAAVETERLYLRPFRFSDSDDFWAIVSRPSNLRFIFPAPKTRTESDVLMVREFMRQPLGVWAIVDKKTEHLIGAIRFENPDVQAGVCELGYFLKESEWGRGYMTEVVKTLAFLSFYEFKLRELVIITHAENSASQRVAEKSGFTLKRTYKGSDRYTRQMRTYHEFGLARKDYRYE